MKVVPPAYEDGTDRVFRNVGIYNSDAGELPKRKHNISAPCFAIRAVKHYMTCETLNMIYYSYFHSIMNYSLVFWGNSSFSNSISKIQKRILGIIMGTGTGDYYREFFEILNIVPLQSQYILLLMLCLWLTIKIHLR